MILKTAEDEVKIIQMVLTGIFIPMMESMVWQII